MHALVLPHSKNLGAHSKTLKKIMSKFSYDQPLVKIESVSYVMSIIQNQ